MAIGADDLLPAGLEKREGSMKMLNSTRVVVASLLAVIAPTAMTDIDLGQLGSLLTSRGYRIVDNPEKANYHLQANVLYVGRDDKFAIRQSSRYGGWGGPVAGVTEGTVAGAGIGRSRR